MVSLASLDLLKGNVDRIRGDSGPPQFFYCLVLKCEGGGKT